MSTTGFTLRCQFSYDCWTQCSAHRAPSCVANTKNVCYVCSPTLFIGYSYIYTYIQCVWNVSGTKAFPLCLLWLREKKKDLFNRGTLTAFEYIYINKKSTNCIRISYSHFTIHYCLSNRYSSMQSLQQRSALSETNILPAFSHFRLCISYHAKICLSQIRTNE